MKRIRYTWVAALLACIILLSGYFSRSRSGVEDVYQRDEGFIFGTVYHMTYRCESSLYGDIRQLLNAFDGSLSPFNKNSVISKVNRNEEVVADEWFSRVFLRSQEIYRETEGAFDPTVSPLINAWGFGYDSGIALSPATVDSLLAFVGMDKITLSDNRIIKQDPRITLNFSAIAKGYACDVIGNYLTEKGVSDYLVEIGGEIVAKGRNPQGDLWSVGINRPDTAARYNRGEISRVLHFSDAGLATSGNYRNYRYIDGKRVAHTIDPVGGYPVQHALLSSTVMADDCMTADAYATAFMVMGLDRSRALLEQHPEIKALFIYALDNDSTAMAVYSTLP